MIYECLKALGFNLIRAFAATRRRVSKNVVVDMGPHQTTVIGCLFQPSGKILCNWDESPGSCFRLICGNLNKTGPTSQISPLEA